MQKMNCDFCNEQTSVKTVYNQIYGNHSRIVYETEHFCLVPCLGQLREGHFLIFSKKHVNSAGVMNHSIIDELKSFVDRVAEYLKREYQMDTICFEHGVLSDDGDNGGCGISHMHIHLLPGTSSEFENLLLALAEDDTNIISLATSISDASDCVENNQTYIFLSKSDVQGEISSYIITNRENYFESQYMRKKVAGVLGKEVWDWKEIKRPEEDFINTLTKAKKNFSCI